MSREKYRNIFEFLCTTIRHILVFFARLSSNHRGAKAQREICSLRQGCRKLLESESVQRKF
jgi:hypothetical protein